MNRRRLLGAALVSPFLSTAPLAAAASHEVQLLAGSRRDGMLLAGLRINLAPEWKTYWRIPGESGIPPQIDWSGSDNAKSVKMLFPAPSRFADASGETIGYHGEVVFPIPVEPTDPEQPVLLRLVALFGVCRDICIPARRELAAQLPAPQPDLRVAIWLQRVPQPVPEGEGSVVTAAHVSQDGGNPVLILTVADTPTDIFVESETDAYFGKPVKGTGPQQWRLPVGNVKDASILAGKPLLVTVAYADKAVEQRVFLD